MAGLAIIQIPDDFWPATVLLDDGETVACLGHDGERVGVAYKLTGDPVENWRRAETLRLEVWWQLNLIRRGLFPEDEGHA